MQLYCYIDINGGTHIPKVEQVRVPILVDILSKKICLVEWKCVPKAQHQCCTYIEL